jgi:hypothetical protein
MYPVAPVTRKSRRSALTRLSLARLVPYSGLASPPLPQLVGSSRAKPAVVRPDVDAGAPIANDRSMPMKRDRRRHRKASRRGQASGQQGGRHGQAAAPAQRSSDAGGPRRGGRRSSKASEREDLAVRQIDQASRELTELARPGRDPQLFAERLPELLSAGTAFNLFQDPEFGALEAEVLAHQVGAERARELAGALCGAGHRAQTWWAVGLYKGAGDTTRAEQVATAAWQAARVGGQVGETALGGVSPGRPLPGEAGAALGPEDDAAGPREDAGEAATEGTRVLAASGEAPTDEQRRDALVTASTSSYELAAMSRVVAGLRLELGRALEAAEMATELCAEDPGDEESLELLARALSKLYEKKEHSPSEEAVLKRFADRSRFDRLRDAVAEFLAARPDLASRVADARQEWVETFLHDAGVDDLDRLAGQHPFAVEPGPEGEAAGMAAAYELLAAENIWALAPAPGPEPGERPPPDEASGASDQGDEGGSFDNGEGAEAGTTSVLERFAADPSTPLDLAVLAHDWQANACYGLWQVANPNPSPGVWVTDIVTRRSLYVAMPPAHLDSLPRWSVLAGFFLPDQGIWRSGGAFAVLDPTEGDRAAEIAWSMVTNMMGAMAKDLKMKEARRWKPVSPRLDRTPPYGVTAALDEPLDEHLATLFASVMAVALPSILGMAWDMRRQAPKMVNTDREPLEFFKLTAHVDDAARLRSALAKRPDFDVGPDGSVAWLGRQMTSMEAESAMAELQEMVARRRLGPVEPVSGPQKWVRGVLHISADRVTVEVNSRKRLEKITQILERLGVREPVVERQFNPDLDMALPAGWRPFAQAGSPASEQAWLRNWLDEKVPALGTTPRLAAREPKTSILLERLLRQFEFGADLARFAGERPLDVEKIRFALAGEDGRPFSIAD